MTLCPETDSSGSKTPRVFVFSHRNIKKRAYRAVCYEFEDIISRIDDVDLAAPVPDLSHNFWQKYTIKLTNKLFDGLEPNFPGVRTRLTREYDLFFVWFSHPWDINALKRIEGWKENCRIKVCWLEEIWAARVEKLRDLLKILSSFDYVILNCAGSIDAVQKTIKRPCVYNPHGVDAIRFCPVPNPPPRVIDVFSIGRNHPSVHGALLELAEKNRIFYLYDQFGRTPISTPAEHRDRYAGIAKRTRYFTVYPGKFDEPHTTRGQIEFGSRFFEGAAAGTVMIGEAPETEVFRRFFDRAEAVLSIPLDSASIPHVLADLDSQPERMEKIRRENVVHSLLNHDWLYRWKLILDTVGLEPGPAFYEREKQLQRLAAMAESL